MLLTVLGRAKASTKPEAATLPPEPADGVWRRGPWPVASDMATSTINKIAMIPKTFTQRGVPG